MTPNNPRTALAQVEAFNRRDLDAQVSGYADTFTMTDHAQGTTLRSKEEVKSWMQAWIAASSDAKVSLVEAIDAGDVVVSVLELGGTNDGPLGPMPASGRRFSTRGVQILHFDKEGRIVAHDNFFDQLSMMVQLGFAEPPPQS
jgi:steroid delta-isomerase-like uncharacterized protein